MPLGMSVIERVKRQIEFENSVRRSHVNAQHDLSRKVNHSQYGQLIWVGESAAPSHDKKKNAMRLSGGKKYSLSPNEIQFFAHTLYEYGSREYVYEGEYTRPKNTSDATDPRGTSRSGFGTLSYPDGTLYEGNWRGDKRQGVGHITTPKGYKYTGDWHDDLPSGNGYEMFACRAAIDAHYEAGVPLGKGTILYDPKLSIYRYEGEWYNGRRHGNGVIFYANGDTFACTFLEGKRHGRGVTTQVINGREIQYETHWQHDKLIGDSKVIPRALCTKKPLSSIPYRMKGYLIAADITTWKVNKESDIFSFDDFMRLKLGFESLDVVGCGFLPLEAFSAAWPEDNLDMLHLLEACEKNSLGFLDIIFAWYSHVPVQTIVRFTQEFISPLNMLQIRGYLNGVEDAKALGYYHVCGNFTSFTCKSYQQPPLRLQDLESAQYQIGDKIFTADDYTAACQLHNPPYLIDVLQVLYPNIFRLALEQYEIEYLREDIVNAIQVDFMRYAQKSSERSSYILIEEFIQAEVKYREHLLATYRKYELISEVTQLDTFNSSVSHVSSINQWAENAVEADMRQGLFKGTGMWILGNCMHLTVPFLLEIENFYVCQKGQIKLSELLRFCFPNVPCLRTQEALLGEFSEIPCTCNICTVLGN